MVLQKTYMSSLKKVLRNISIAPLPNLLRIESIAPLKKVLRNRPMESLHVGFAKKGNGIIAKTFANIINRLIE